MEEDVGAFVYVVTHFPADETTFLCVELLITMGWVKFPLLFCGTSETVEDLENLYIAGLSSSFTKYGPTSISYYTLPSRTAYLVRLQGTDIYMDYLMCVSQGYPVQTHGVTDLVL